MATWKKEKAALNGASAIAYSKQSFWNKGFAKFPVF